MASEAGLIFDFDGLGPLGNRLFYTGFGGQIKPRYVASKHSLSYRAMTSASRVLTGWFSKGHRSDRGSETKDG